VNSDRLARGGLFRFREDAGDGVSPKPELFAALLVPASWLAVAALAASWWGDGAISWATLWPATAAGGLALWATLE
jgi:hypothetical protein